MAHKHRRGLSAQYEHEMYFCSQKSSLLEQWTHCKELVSRFRSTSSFETLRFFSLGRIMKRDHSTNSIKTHLFQNLFLFIRLNRLWNPHYLLWGFKLATPPYQPIRSFIRRPYYTIPSPITAFPPWLWGSIVSCQTRLPSWRMPRWGEKSKRECTK